jgi:general secretion pathway protein E
MTVSGAGLQRISPDVIADAMEMAGVDDDSMLLVLQRLTGLVPERLVQMVSAQTGIACLGMAELETLQADFDSVGYAECLQRQCIVLVDANGRRVFVNDNPFDGAMQSWASYLLPGEFRLAFTHPVALKALLSRFETHQSGLSLLVRLEQPGSSVVDTEEISLTSIAQDESQVVRLVNSTLYDAHKAGSSDIHFENTAQGLTIKYRIDGVLSAARSLPDTAIADQVISRIKVMAELDIGERRIPQDGRFAVTMTGREIDFRVSIMPGLWGEDAVLRILDRQSLTAELSQLDLGMLGFDEVTRESMRRLANQPYGMMLVTGPTGSGKTTSLYATLSEINRGDDKIITIEDPVEYQLHGVLQIPVNEKKGLTFARGLRSILRHDPDRILVGEIRDHETAEIAVQAALTGHLVFTSVHANSVFDVISRFRHMGIDLYSFVTAVNGIVAQRLVRLCCTDCAVKTVPSPSLLAVSGLSDTNVDDFDFRQGRGCANCRGTGYRGRRALAEVLIMSDVMRELVLRQAPVSALKEEACNQGMPFIRDQALMAVRMGQTTLQEINRVTFVD